MNNRKLAHIEEIQWIKDIPGADKIQVCGILGWECVIKKNEFKVGEKVIYIEVDSVMPNKPEYEFLRSKNFRIKTIKLKGQVSQGLVLPLSILPTDFNAAVRKGEMIGMDVTELLGITKYLSKSEQEELTQQVSKKHWTKNYKITFWLWKYKWFRKHILPNKSKSDFPYWVSKTDELRVQSLHWEEFYEKFKDRTVYITEKIDFQSGSWTGKLEPMFFSSLRGFLRKLIPIKKYHFIVCSRNHVTNDKNSLYWRIAKKYNIEQILKENPTLTIQGEQGDTKVQGNKYGIKEPTMWVFNIIDYERNYHYDWEEIKAFCVKYNLKCIPELRFNIKLSALGSTVQELVEFSKGKSVINPNIEREGIVVRCIENGKKLLSFKVINPNFLLQYE